MVRYGIYPKERSSRRRAPSRSSWVVDWLTVLSMSMSIALKHRVGRLGVAGVALAAAGGRREHGTPRDQGALRSYA